MPPRGDLCLQARFCAVKCFFQAHRDMPTAMQYFEQEWNSVHPEHLISDTEVFINLAVVKFETEYDLRDPGTHGRPP